MKTFEIGRVIATTSVWELLETNADFNRFVSECLSRYILYDWGDTDKNSWEKNDLAVSQGGRVVAVYFIPDEIEETFNDQIWFFTEADRSTTTIMFLGEF